MSQKIHLMNYTRTPELMVQKLKKDLLQQGIELDLRNGSLDTKDKALLKKEVQSSDLSLMSGGLCIDVASFLNHRSVGSHFLTYTDFVENHDSQLWGYCLFSDVFLECLLKAVKNQDYKGSVIFLGESALTLPTVQVLSHFGFRDFDFLKVNEDKEEGVAYIGNLKGLLNIKTSPVDSTAFIQSQKEYSFCFVMEDDYSKQTLDDMSYFHFLSSNSLVFDLSGRSNFLFDEVSALGVEIIKYQEIADVYFKGLAKKIVEYAKKRG